MSLKALKFHTLILFSLVLFSFGSEAKAQDSITIDIPDNQTAAPGSNVSIPVNYTYNTAGFPANIPSGDPRRIVSFSFVVNFDPNVINTTAIDPDSGDPIAIDQAGTLTATGFACTADTNTPGRLGVACATGGSGIPQTQGTLIKLVFKVVGQPAPAATCCTNLTFSQAAGEAPRFTRFDAAVVPTTATGGSFFIAGATSASVTVSGRVLTTNGRGLKGAQVRLTTADGTTRTVVSSAFGNYRFADIQAGQTVTIEIISKRYGFQSQTFNLSGDISDVNFIAEP